MTRLTVRHANLGYARRPVLRDVSFTVPAGEICCLLGANGSGKTTLMRTILGVLPLISGDILLDGVAVQRFSDRERASAFAFTALDMVMMGLTPKMAAFAVPGAREREIAQQQLAALEIVHLAHRRWNTLSGGERQLVLIARALAQRPRLLLLDEPASSLDFGHQIRLLDTLVTLKKTGMALLMSTHHPLHARAIADSVVRVESDGQVSQGA
ncbi:ABC transporter ATP-binding protein, partial [Citrobacter koseri]|uniref:ABC transporter ATP-binding protein n=1 Tax=Citrobacter koseri TaxID=545 RepID=UPI00200A5A4A